MSNIRQIAKTEKGKLHLMPHFSFDYKGGIASAVADKVPKSLTGISQYYNTECDTPNENNYYIA